MCTLPSNTIHIKEEIKEIYEETKGFTINDKKDPIAEETTSTKCGEVFFKGESLLFTCSFCENKFHKIKSFICHFMKSHLGNDLSDNILQEVLYGEVDDQLQQYNDKLTLKNKIPAQWNSIEENLDEFQIEYPNDQLIEVVTDFESNNAKDEKANDCENYDESVEENIFSEEEKVDDELQPEINKVTNSSSVTCKVCNKTFRRLCDYRRHEKGGHIPEGSKKKYKYKYVSDTKRFICETCGKGFKTNYHLKQHQHVHTGERPYKCELCPQTFAKSRHMVFHMRYHLNDRRYKCQYCDKAFVEQTKRRLHEMIHTGTFPFKCSICDKGFRCRSKLNVHVKRHENDRMYKCEKCDKSFFDINLLRGHAAVHSNEKPFACEICPARFPRKGALRLHMHLHSDKKKYSCKICEKEFHQYNGIYTHMKSHGIKYSTAYEKGESDGKNDTVTTENNLDLDN